MSVRIAYDDPADAMDPAMDGHAEQLRRIDAEDARRYQAREAEHTPPHSDGSRPPVAEGPSSAGGRPLQTPSAPEHLTERELPVVIDPGYTQRRIERLTAERDGWFTRARDAEAERNVERMRAEKAEASVQRRMALLRLADAVIADAEARAEKAEAALDEIGKRAYSVPGRMHTNDSISTQRQFGAEQFAAEILFLIAEHGYGAAEGGES